MMDDNLDYLLNTLVLPGDVWDEREGKHFLGKRALAEITRLRAENEAQAARIRELELEVAEPSWFPAWLDGKNLQIEALVKERDEALALCESLRTHLKMTEKERDEAREALEWAKEATQPIASLVAMTAEGFPDHDICPIRLGQARAIAEAHAAIDAALKEGGE